nr:sulfite reductase flavoprotein subunit alpha [Solimonas soli]
MPRPFDRSLLAQALLGLLLVALAFALHGVQTAPPPAPPSCARLALAGVLLLVWLGCSAIPFAAQRRRRPPPALTVDGDDLLVVHASQTGFAEQLARQTAAALQAAGVGLRLVSLGDMTAAALQGRRALFIVSTTGEGDAPDAAWRFVRRAMAQAATLDTLRYGVLALGDRSYARFCAFGHQLEHWLRLSGAQPLFDLVEVDKGDAAALRHWQHHLRSLGGHAEMADWRAPAYQRAELLERRCLNPRGFGAPAFHLRLKPPAGAGWRAGDLVEIGPCNDDATLERWLCAAGIDANAMVGTGAQRQAVGVALRDRLLPAIEEARGVVHEAELTAWLARLPPLPHREYSIASLPQDGVLELVVRQVRDAAGRLGLGSGWLTAHAPVGAALALRVRVNRNFHLDDHGQPLLLIGNGTGIAGLRAHLKARVAAGQHRNWLLFGERSAQHDFFFGDEIAAWQRAAMIEHVDLAFSRDQAERVYVQQRLAARRERLAAWLADGAHVLVCGSLEGMAPAVDAVLREVLGASAYDAFVESGRYRRDVY